MKNFPLYLILLLALASCERDANIEVPAIDPMISVTCFISPQDTVLIAHITRVNPLFGDEGSGNNYEIHNAEVTLSDGNTTATLQYDELLGYYRGPITQLAILPGETYYLRIEANGYPTLTASTTVPLEQPTELTATVDDLGFVSNSFESSFVLTVDLAWNDIEANDSYFRGVISFTDTIDYDGILQIDHYDVVNFLDEDELPNQGRIEQKHTGSIFAYNIEEPEQFKFHLLNCNKDYYEFHKSVENINYGSPFSEPSLIYSNTSGGLGVFGAYQKSSITFAP
jgi:hypothetical protein